MAVVARNFAHAHLIECRRDGADAVLRQNEPQQPRKLLSADLLSAENLHELVEHVAEDLPQLCTLLRELHLAARHLLRGLLLQRLRRAGALRKCVKGFRLPRAVLQVFSPSLS